METITKIPEPQTETFYAKPRLRTERTVTSEYNPMSDPIQVMKLVLGSYYGITLEDVCINCRIRAIKYIRQSVQTILHRKGKVNLCTVGMLTCRTHATILNSIKCVCDDEFIYERQGVSSPLLDVYNDIDKKFTRLYKPLKYTK